MNCKRCDFATDSESEVPEAEQLAEHALAASHPLCPCCGNSLDQADPINGCERCLTKAREHLAGIQFMYDELPDHLGHVRSPVYDGTPRGDDGPPLPGGDVLVLLAGGSEGLEEDDTTTKEGDVGSVAFELHWWEKALREERRDEHDDQTVSTAALVRHAAAYLEVHARWAANNLRGFPELAADLRRLHRVLERATGRADAHVVAEAGCLTCGGQLVQALHPRLEDDRPRRKGTVHEGYQDGFTCTSCGREYRRPGPDEKRPDEYAIALKQHFHLHPQEWAPAYLICDWHPPVTPDLLRQWKKREQVATAVRYGVTLYRVADVVARLEARSA